MSEAIDLSSLVGAESAELDRLRTALKASGDVIYEWDIATDAICRSANVKQSLGLASSVDISTHANLVKRINSEDRAALDRTLGNCLTTGGAFQVEYRVRGHDGRFRRVGDHGVVRFMTEGRATSVTGAIRLIISHKLARGPARVADQLRRSDRALQPDAFARFAQSSVGLRQPP